MGFTSLWSECFGTIQLKISFVALFELVPVP